MTALKTDPKTESKSPIRHYASFGLARSIRQVVGKLRSLRHLDEELDVRLERLGRDRRRMGELLGREVRDLDVLVVGHGPQLVEARYLGVHNRVVGIDLDVNPRGLNPLDYVKMWRLNGPGRVFKTLGRKILLADRAFENAWAARLGVERLPEPRLLIGDVCDPGVELAPADLVVSWSVFQHLPDPGAALRRMRDILRPGGALYFGLHLYTSNSGHHDIRAFTGDADDLPAWGHLREATRHQIHPSAFLNRWRLGQWRELLAAECPGYIEYRQTYIPEGETPEIPAQLRDELADYTDEELFTVDLFFGWRKPADPGPVEPPAAGGNSAEWNQK